jgi:hypothetical protein
VTIESERYVEWNCSLGMAHGSLDLAKSYGVRHSEPKGGSRIRIGVIGASH